jgi:hypothetical protein
VASYSAVKPMVCTMSEKKPERMSIHGERLKRYRPSYLSLIGSYDSAKEAYEAYKDYETIRPLVDRQNKGR